MAFIKEFVPEQDKELFNSFKMYNYENNSVFGWNDCRSWVVDRERKIYFTRVGGYKLETHAQYDLIWNGKKIVIFTESTGNLNMSENPPAKERIWDILSIRVPKGLEACNDELAELIKSVIEFYHSIDIANGEQYIKATSKLVFGKFAQPIYFEEVK